MLPSSPLFLHSFFCFHSLFAFFPFALFFPVFIRIDLDYVSCSRFRIPVAAPHSSLFPLLLPPFFHSFCFFFCLLSVIILGIFPLPLFFFICRFGLCVMLALQNPGCSYCSRSCCRARKSWQTLSKQTRIIKMRQTRT